MAVSEFPKRPAENDAEQRAKEYARAVTVMLEALPLAERERVIRLLADSIRPADPNTKAGDVLGVIVRLLPKNQRWSVDEFKKVVEEHGVSATDKQVFNALGYLTRKGRIKRIGYGRYEVNGIPIVTADDLGGQPSITEGDLDD